MSIAAGIEIGGTKLQVGIGLKDEKLIALARIQVDPTQGAEGIRKRIPQLMEEALKKAGVTENDLCGIGVGFGGPVNSKDGKTIISHQIEGWDHFPLKQWLEEHWDIPVSIQNDASIAGYAEAHIGAGRGLKRVFYITIGSGIGGGLINDGVIDEGQGFGAAEIGHTWIPEPETGEAEKLELVCSGWSIGRRAREALEFGEESLMSEMCDHPDEINAQIVYQAAEQNDLLAQTILDETCTGLAIAICNVIALLNPDKIIIGGGVSLMGPLFWNSLQDKIKKYVFQPFSNHYEVVPAALGEEVVVIGATLLGMNLKF